MLRNMPRMFWKSSLPAGAGQLQLQASMNVFQPLSSSEKALVPGQEVLDVVVENLGMELEKAGRGR